MTTENEIGAAALAMYGAERAARSPHGLTEGDCRVLARLALEAAENQRRLDQAESDGLQPEPA